MDKLNKPSTSTQFPDTPDVTKLIELSNGNKEFALRMINSFVKQSEHLILNIRKYLKREDYFHLRYEAHRLIGASRILSINNVAKTIQALENCYQKKDNNERIQTLAKQLKAQLQVSKFQLDEIGDDLIK